MKHRYLVRARGACGQRALFLLVDVSFLSGKRFLWQPRWLPLVMSLIPKFEDAIFFKHTLNSPPNFSHTLTPPQTHTGQRIRAERGGVGDAICSEGGRLLVLLLHFCINFQLIKM